ISGPVVKSELEMVKKLLNPERPSVMLVGGAKAVNKFGALKFNLDNDKIDYALVSGVTGLMMQVASGVKFSDADEEFVASSIKKVGKEVILDVITKYKDKIIFPIDNAVEENGKRVEYDTEKLGEVNLSQGDIGAKSQEKFREIVMKAKTIVANGPPGIFENEAVFSQGSFALVKAMAEATEKNGAFTVIGGGEMGTAAEMTGIADKISRISTGGGALLEIISGKKVPLMAALASKPPK
ncbi:MAG: phosphoglycerate kinase, partial [archaeon]|nr:phosphoglycerate kinase [archaeon]